MKRLHLHVSVPSIEQAVAFYTTLFNAPPSVLKTDYAKWMLEDPRVNLAISSRARATGVDHVGVQVDSPDELAELASRLKAAGETTLDQEATTCCYAKSDKSWVTDTAGVRWETFYTHGDATEYGEDEALPDPAVSACCAAPAAPRAACC
ncbi:ArsI/CadI family heavy metal resistance metalloenzyme [Govanella unica]|uniref:VOC family protein n=1 Tax=Govanella unica TaxID=2975056 RepID=A0A9X3Z7U8_9PROT|nr:ArsI/CadI family heavy metal resistance metalloenzyme [Govania unica]MDA5194374.1 VOC family protein [Govania unica]